MARPRKLDAFQSAIQSIGAQLGQALGEAFTQAFTQGIDRGHLSTPSSAAKGRRGRPPSATGGAGCKVPSCPRKSVAKGMCQNHYAKARRLKMKIDSLGAAQLKELAQDGRVTRFK
ncbi:MAG: hypothetical protein JST54_10475 [Deltaproteobacteria bacterium]|nr:hypothetical protein [Deltaproteobacteria bacterium]